MTTTQARFVIAFGALAVIGLRMTIPSHGLTGWPGAVETLAHFWVGGMIVACVFWRDHSLNVFADHDDVYTITRRINGGLNGLASRRTYLARAKQALR